MQKNETVVVDNRRPHLIGVPPMPATEDGPATKGFQLSPGENNVPRASWERYAATKHGQKLINTVRWLKLRNKAKATPMVENLSAVEQDKAVALIEGCKSHELLKLWARNDPRSRSQNAIQRRLEAFAVPKVLDDPEPVPEAAPEMPKPLEARTEEMPEDDPEDSEDKDSEAESTPTESAYSRSGSTVSSRTKPRTKPASRR